MYTTALLTCVKAPSSRFSAIEFKNPRSTNKIALVTKFPDRALAMCLCPSVMITPGWRAFDVTPVPLRRTASSFENRMLANLLWPYASLCLRFNMI
jgi:hypothetical protein